MELIEKQQAAEAIKTVVLARWFFVTVAIVQVVLVQMLTKPAGTMTLPILALLAGVCYGYNFIYWLYLRRSPEKMSSFSLQLVQVFQVVGDMAVISVMLYFDRTVNIFVAAFFLDVILIASVLYRTTVILLVVAGTCLLYAVLALFEYFGFFPPMKALYYYTLKGNLILFGRTLIIFFTCIIGAGFLSGCIAALFRRRERRLEKQMKITEEARLAQETEKNKVAAVLQNLTDGLLMLDWEGRVILINNEAEKMLGVGKSSVIARSLSEVESPVFKQMSEVIEKEKGLVKRHEIEARKDPELIFELSTATVVDINERELGRLLIIHDITREKAIDRMKSEFVTIAAHQLRTPLSAIKWALNLVIGKDLGELNLQQEDTLKKGYQSNERIIALINDLLNVAKIEEGRFINKFTEANFFEVVKSVVSEFEEPAKRKKIIIKTELEAELILKLDKEKISLALRNLIENAINYSAPDSIVQVSAKKEGGRVVFSVRDRGIGVPKIQQPRLFSKFFRGDNAVRTETEGSGLGLFIVKNIVESHGGRVWFESEEGKGSAFFFELPLILNH